MKKPNLFIVGEPKSGTTALHSMLMQHPDVFMSSPKELGFFRKKNKMTKKQYLSHFKNVNREIYAGESTPTYMHDLTAARKIYNFNPEARIIMIFRNPVDYMVSFHKQLVRNPGSKISPNIKKAMHEMKHELDYYSHAKQFYDYFPPKQIMILSYEEFFEEPKKEFKKLAEWLGIDTGFEPEAKVLNKSPQSTLKHRVYNKVRKYLPFLDKILRVKSIHSKEYWKNK